MKEELNIDKEVLLFRYSNGIATPEEKAQVEKLIVGSSEISNELKRVQDAVDLKNKIREMESYNVTAGYSNVRKAIQKTNQRKRLITIVSRVAAILAIPLLISTLSLLYVVSEQKQNDVVVYAEVIAAPGTVAQFELPDKSKVWLNSNSVLRYPTRFEGSSTREVELEGEGFFEVESDRERPFYVNTTSGMKVMAYGTQFNVNTEKKTIETVLATGKVALFYKDDLLGNLTTGEQASFDMETKKLEKKEINLAEKLAWKDGKIIFRNAPLPEVFDRLSRRYNVDIILHDEHNQSGNYLSRVTFTNETLQQIFTYLEIAAPITWKLSSPTQNNDSSLMRQRVDVWLKKK